MTLADAWEEDTESFPVGEECVVTRFDVLPNGNRTPLPDAHGTITAVMLHHGEPECYVVQIDPEDDPAGAGFDLVTDPDRVTLTDQAENEHE